MTTIYYCTHCTSLSQKLFHTLLSNEAKRKKQNIRVSINPQSYVILYNIFGFYLFGIIFQTISSSISTYQIGSQKFRLKIWKFVYSFVQLNYKFPIEICVNRHFDGISSIEIYRICLRNKSGCHRFIKYRK